MGKKKDKKPSTKELQARVDLLEKEVARNAPYVALVDALLDIVDKAMDDRMYEIARDAVSERIW